MTDPLTFTLTKTKLLIGGSKSYINQNKIKALGEATFNKVSKTWEFNKPSASLINASKELVKSVNEYYAAASTQVTPKKTLKTKSKKKDLDSSTKTKKGKKLSTKKDTAQKKAIMKEKKKEKDLVPTIRKPKRKSLILDDDDDDEEKDFVPTTTKQKGKKLIVDDDDVEEERDLVSTTMTKTEKNHHLDEFVPLQTSTKKRKNIAEDDDDYFAQLVDMIVPENTPFGKNEPLKNKIKWFHKTIKEIFDKTKLTSEGWTVCLNKNKARAGVCKYMRKEICVSREFIKVQDQVEILNTILHEVAHALAGPRAKHGPQWKELFISMGGNGKRCCDSFSKGKYTLTCPNKCFEQSRHKRIDVSKRICKTCKQHVHLI